MEINKSISHLRAAAFLLFFVPFLGLVGSLIFHNSLVSIKKITKGHIYPFEEFKVGNKIQVECSEQNNWCRFKVVKRFDQCQKYKITEKYLDHNGFEISFKNEWSKLRDNKKKSLLEVEITNTKSESCIFIFDC